MAKTMRMLLKRRARGVLAASAILVLAGCATAQPLALPGSLQDGRAASRATSGDLIYATAADGKNIYIFSYPDGKLVRKIAPPAGTIALQGLCTDTSGNVFVTSLAKPPKSGVAAGHVYEYARDSSKILKTLTFNRARPFGCSVDAKTGTLAVSTVGLASGGSGELETFTHGSYYGTTYGSYDIQNYYYCAYDGSGNLFVNGQGTGTQMYVDELKAGSKALAQISLNKYVSVSGMGQLQWDGSHLALEDLTAGAIYRLSVSGSDAKVVGTSRLDGWNGASLSAIAGASVIVPTGASGTSIGFWKYPAGGKVVRNVSVPSGLFGLAIGAGTQQ